VTVYRRDELSLGFIAADDSPDYSNKGTPLLGYPIFD
jgi:hypothetical protein